MTLVVIAGCEVVDHSLDRLESAAFYYDFITTAKWLLVAGFALHALINWFASKR